MSALPTVRIRRGDDYVIINESDYDPEVDELYEEGEPEQEPAPEPEEEQVYVEPESEPEPEPKPRRGRKAKS